MIEESAIEFEGEDVNEEEIVDEFKKFLDDVSPDQFAVDDEQQPVVSGRASRRRRRFRPGG